MTKPILFSTEMVRALLAGRKTVTRRVIKPQPKSRLSYVCMGHKCGSWSYPGADAWKYWKDESFRLPDGLTDEDKNKCWTPPYHSGDILYVRETWAQKQDDECRAYKTGICPYESCDKASGTCFGLHYIYRASDSLPPLCGWRPSIHMPQEAARIFLQVTNVRVERLQNIEAAEIEAEGLSREPLDEVGEEFYRGIFSDLWDSTIKPKDRSRYGWAANPWVWVIKFEQISKEEADIWKE